MNITELKSKAVFFFFNNLFLISASYYTLFKIELYNYENPKLMHHDKIFIQCVVEQSFRFIGNQFKFIAIEKKMKYG